MPPYSLRRKRFQNYRKRAESLNAVCKSIVSLANVNTADVALTVLEARHGDVRRGHADEVRQLGGGLH